MLAQAAANISAKAWIMANKAVLAIYFDWRSLYNDMGNQWINLGYKPSWADNVSEAKMNKFLNKLNS